MIAQYDSQTMQTLLKLYGVRYIIQHQFHTTSPVATKSSFIYM